MAISINPVLPVLPAQEAGSVAPELVLQPGSVVNAQVLKVLSADLVRIAIASLSIDVASEIPLQQGQNLQLAVTQTKDGGIRLALLGQGGGRCRRRHLVTGRAGRCGGQSADHRVTEERADAAGARSGLYGRPGRGDRTGQPGAAVCQSRRGGFLQQFAAETASRDRAGAGATDQPRSEPRRRRHQDGVPEVRNLPRGVAGGGLSPVERRSRPQGRADRASPDAAVGAWRQFDGRDTGDAGRGAAGRVATDRRPEPCTVFVARRRYAGNPAAAGAIARRRKFRGGRPGRPQSACGRARRRTFGRRDPEPAAGSAAGTRQPGAGCRHAERRSVART